MSEDQALSFLAAMAFLGLFYLIQLGEHRG